MVFFRKERMKKKYLYVVFMVVLIGYLQGCIFSGDVKKDTAMSLIITKDVFVETARSAKHLCAAGALSYEECEFAQDAYSEGKEKLAKAKTIWDSMIDTESFARRAEYDGVLGEVMRLTDLIDDIVRENE